MTRDMLVGANAFEPQKTNKPFPNAGVEETQRRIRI